MVQIKGGECEQKSKWTTESVDEYQSRWQDFRLESKRLRDNGKVEIIKNDDKYTVKNPLAERKLRLKKYLFDIWNQMN